MRLSMGWGMGTPLWDDRRVSDIRMWRVERKGSPPAWFLSESVATGYAERFGGTVIPEQVVTETPNRSPR